MHQNSQTLHIRLAELGPDDRDIGTWGLLLTAWGLFRHLTYMGKNSPIVWILHNNNANGQMPLSNELLAAVQLSSKARPCPAQLQPLLVIDSAAIIVPANLIPAISV